MTIGEKIQADIVVAMKAREEHQADDAADGEVGAEEQRD